MVLQNVSKLARNDTVLNYLDTCYLLEVALEILVNSCFCQFVQVNNSFC